jgi:hypothetical protein
MFLIFISLIFFVGFLLYLINVRMGSSIYTYNSEIGIQSSCCRREKFTSNEFFGKMVPLQLASIGLPLLFCNVVLGAVLLVLSLILFLLRAKDIE